MDNEQIKKISSFNLLFYTPFPYISGKKKIVPFSKLPKELKDVLKPYDKEAVCKKCSNERISNRYTYRYENVNGVVLQNYETIKRTCSNCGYMWDELPIAVK